MAIAALMMAATSFAQTSSGSFSFDQSRLYYGARLGLSAAGITDLDTKAGLTLAGVIGLRVSDTTPVFLESGLYFTQRGGKGDVKVGGATAKYDVSLNYLEIPVLIKYGIPVTDGVSVMPLIGPYFSWAIGGKTKETVSAGGAEVVTKHSSFNDGYYKHPDMGIKVGCGAEYNNLYLELAYKFGIANIANADNVTAHGHAFTVNFGVNF